VKCFRRSVVRDEGGKRLERFRFGSDVAFAPREELLQGVTVAPLSRSIFQGSPFQAAVFRVAPGGRIVRHPATYPQVLAVLDGSGTVSGPGGVDEPIEAGEAVFWQAGEEHETKTAEGLTALIIEGDGLEIPKADVAPTSERGIERG
jgi:quercetin dioxygenase-like cupin family protein